MERFLTDEHRVFQDVFRKYLQSEIVPHHREWEKNRHMPRSVWRDMGKYGFLCPWAPEEYGGAGADFGYSFIIDYELARFGLGVPAPLHNDIVTPYLFSFGSAEQKQRWMPGCVSGDIVTAVAMTEPSGGSDLQALRTSAVRDGNEWVINGQKVFISSGTEADLIFVVCRTNPKAPGRSGLSMIAVEADTRGLERRKLEKMGNHAADVGELFFDDVRVPVGNLLGEENQAFKYLMEKLQTERLVTCILCQGAAERVLDLSLEYAKSREAFGQPIASFQANQFKLAEMATEVALGQSFTYDLMSDYMQGKEIVTKVSMGKWWISEMLNRIAYQGVQLHGGYGYMDEYEISRLYRDARFHTIAAGTTEIMKLSIAKFMGLGAKR